MTNPYSWDLVLFSLFSLWTESSHLYFHTGIYLIFSFSHVSFPAGRIFLLLQNFLSCLFNEISFRYLYFFNTGPCTPSQCLSSILFKVFIPGLFTREMVGKKKRRKSTQGQVFAMNNCNFYQRVAWFSLPFAIGWLISNKGEK